MEDIKVHVVDYGRSSLYMRYVDPVTGKQKTRSTGTNRRKQAEKIAAKWEAELQEGRYKSPSKVSWEEFRDRYEDEVLPGLADGTASKWSATANSIEALCPVKRLADLTGERISKWQNKLREQKRSETTIKSHSAHLKAALRWAKDVGLLHEVPKIRMPQRAKNSKVMKGRPITGEEFERLLAAVPKVVGEERAASWRHLLRGLWWSGLRLGEALALHWESGGMQVDLTGRHPMFRIAAAAEKGNQDRILPIAPEFAESLLAVPVEERTGYVFNPTAQRVHGPRLGLERVSKVIAKIGEQAGVKVDETTRAGDPHVKYASAHDLRRSFGDRWATRVMPAVLQQLMRHESIDTTMRFYVGQNANATAEVLYAAVNRGGNFSSNTPAEPAPNEGKEKAATPCEDTA